MNHLDADSKEEYNLKISLNDNSFGMSREIIRVKIIITDTNDNPPAFKENPLKIAVPENAPIGSPIYAISAKDIDNENNDSIRYNLYDQFPQEYFKIDSLSGELFVVKKLNFETSPKIF